MTKEKRSLTTLATIVNTFGCRDDNGIAATTNSLFIHLISIVNYNSMSDCILV